MDPKSTPCLIKETKIIIPATPDLKKIGYGTGVGIFHVSPGIGHNNSPWALKKLVRGTRCNQTVMGKRLRDEANILRKLDHPNIVGFRAFLRTPDGRECLAMEECNSSLGDLLEENVDIFSASIVSKVAVEIAKALNYIHNIVHLLHGDIKSHNILIKGNFDVIKLCDFGVSLPLKDDGHMDVDAAGKNATYIGTLMWCAPEVCPGKTSPIIITDKADLFAYGLTIWEMFSNKSPHTPDVFDESDESFNEEAYDALIDELIGTRPPVPENIKNDESYETIVALFEKCTEKDYQMRFSAKQALQFCSSNKGYE